MNQESNVNTIAKLKWACRRGMLELDVLLGNFLAEAYPRLPEAEQRLFVQLLECTDPELFAWLMGREQPPSPELAAITDIIRSHARSRLSS